MKFAGAFKLASGAVAAVALSACFTTKTHPPTSNPPTTPVTAPPANSPVKPIFPQSVPDAVPRVEPKSRYGNPPFYDVFGHRYYVLSSGVAYVERGVASWYGPGFHQVRTSNGDTYDMYGMTAAHKSLPLPAYVRVTNLQNGRSVVVRVNDRGPFVGNRIIDLSYTAAAKLDMLRNGTAFVEVRAIDPTAPASDPSTPLSAGPPSLAMPSTPGPGGAKLLKSGMQAAGIALFVQAGAFSDSANAERLAAKLRSGSYGKIFVRDDVIAGRKLYRVRIGPVPTVVEFDRIVAALDRSGVHDAHLAMD